MTLGIDASTAGSGGAQRHLIELLSCYDPTIHGFDRVIIWGVSDFLSKLSEKEYIIKVTDPWLNKGFLYRILWQVFLRDRAFRNKCDILLSVFGTYTGKNRPYVAMSRNMLIFDASERRRFGLSLMRIKLKMLFYTQKKSFKNASGVIFLSQFAKESIESQVDLSKVDKRIIHHGMSSHFIKHPVLQKEVSCYSDDNPFRFLYVSAIWVYKHQWNVVKAVSNLRKKGYPVTIDIIGNEDDRKSSNKLRDAITELDPSNEFVNWKTTVGLSEVAQYYHSADAFVFASTCENMPNILIEAMSAGLPIVCSAYPPMPEFLKEGGVYVDPIDSADLEAGMEKILTDAALRQKKAAFSFAEAKKYTWDRCANETFSFLNSIVKKNNEQHV